jgi:hypothetical protein
MCGSDSDIRRDIVKAGAAISEVERDLARTQAMVCEILNSQGGGRDQDQSVSFVRTLSVTERTLIAT